MVPDQERIKEAMVDAGKAYVYKSDALKEANLLAVARILFDKQGRIELVVENTTTALILEQPKTETLMLKFVSRGTLFIITASMHFHSRQKITVERVIEVKKFRLRKFFRVNTDIEFTAWCLDDDEKPTHELTVSKVGHANISGGGFFFYVTEMVDVNAKLELRMNLGKQGEVDVMARVIRCNMVSGRTEVHSVAVEYLEIPGTTRDKILNFVAEVQRAQLMRGVCFESR